MTAHFTHDGYSGRFRAVTASRSKTGRSVSTSIREAGKACKGVRQARSIQAGTAQSTIVNVYSYHVHTAVKSGRQATAGRLKGHAVRRKPWKMEQDVQLRSCKDRDDIGVPAGLQLLFSTTQRGELAVSKNVS